MYLKKGFVPIKLRSLFKYKNTIHLYFILSFDLNYSKLNKIVIFIVQTWLIYLGLVDFVPKKV